MNPRRYILLAWMLALAAPAHAEPLPPPPVPPAEAEELIQHYRVWRADDGSWVYVVTRKRKTACALADLDGSGAVGTPDYLRLIESWGCEEPSE